MDHRVTAEGVENERQKMHLIKCGCDKAQGFFISKPLDKYDAIDFFEKYNG